MTYNERLNKLAAVFAEKIMEGDKKYQWRFLSAASKKKRIKKMLPLAMICLQEMSVVAKDAYLEGCYRGAILDTEYLNSLGINPET